MKFFCVCGSQVSTSGSTVYDNGVCNAHHSFSISVLVAAHLGNLLSLWYMNTISGILSIWHSLIWNHTPSICLSGNELLPCLSRIPSASPTTYICWLQRGRRSGGRANATGVRQVKWSIARIERCSRQPAISLLNCSAVRRSRREGIGRVF